MSTFMGSASRSRCRRWCRFVFGALVVVHKQIVFCPLHRNLMVNIVLNRFNVEGPVFVS